MMLLGRDYRLVKKLTQCAREELVLSAFGRIIKHFSDRGFPALAWQDSPHNLRVTVLIKASRIAFKSTFATCHRVEIIEDRGRSRLCLRNRPAIAQALLVSRHHLRG